MEKEFEINLEETTLRIDMGAELSKANAFAEEVYADKTLQLEHGDTLVMFTDGVTEAMNPTLKEFAG